MRNFSQLVNEPSNTQGQPNTVPEQSIVQPRHAILHTLHESLNLKRNQQAIQVVRMNELSKKVGLAKSTLYKMLADEKFPRGFSINGGKATGWLSSTVDQWLLDRADSINRVEELQP